MDRERHDTTDTLNDLLKGEISAVETYQQALEKAGNDPDAVQLREIQRDHSDAVEKLRDEVVRHGGSPVETSGGWGAFAKTMQGAASIFGDSNAIRALREGEEKGLRDFDQALNDESLPVDTQRLIRDELLMRQRSHVQVLDSMIERR
jgi:hypothetical protein